MTDLYVWSKQKYTHFHNFYSENSCDFSKVHNSQKFSLKNWKKIKKLKIEKSNCCGSNWSFKSIRLSCDRDDLVLTKLHALGFTYESVRVIHAYVSNRFQVQKLILPIARLLQLFMVLDFGFDYGSILKEVTNLNFLYYAHANFEKCHSFQSWEYILGSYIGPSNNTAQAL